MSESETLKALRRAITISPTDLQLRVNLGTALEAAGSPEAITQFRLVEFAMFVRGRMRGRPGESIGIREGAESISVFSRKDGVEQHIIAFTRTTLEAVGNKRILFKLADGPAIWGCHVGPTGRLLPQAEAEKRLKHLAERQAAGAARAGEVGP